MSPDHSTGSVTPHAYQELVQARRRLVVPLAAATLVFFFLQQILTNFTSALDGLAFSGMTWAYLYAFAQFVFVVVLTTFYRRRMQQIEDGMHLNLDAAGSTHYDDWTTMETHDRAEEADGDEQFQHAQGTRMDEEGDPR